MNEHDSEPVRGLPAVLPPGETILWQGAPEWRMLARRAFHVVGVGIYFCLLLAWSVAAGLAAGDTMAASIGAMLRSAVMVVPIAVAAIGLLMGLAWLTARTTLYTITNRRVVMRFGIALPISINLPYRQVASAGLRMFDGGTGDIPLALKPGGRTAYLMMWPHVRPWRVARAEPMLRAVPDAARVAQVLARALSAMADQPPQPAPADRMVAAGAAPLASPAAA